MKMYYFTFLEGKLTESSAEVVRSRLQGDPTIYRCVSVNNGEQVFYVGGEYFNDDRFNLDRKKAFQGLKTSTYLAANSILSELSKVNSEINQIKELEAKGI